MLTSLMRTYVTDQRCQASQAYRLQPATHRLYAVARPPAQAAPDSGKVPTIVTHHIMGYYSFNRPRRDGWLSWPCWSTDSGRFTHEVVTRPAVSLAQDRESSPAMTGGLTTMLRHQHLVVI